MLLSALALTLATAQASPAPDLTVALPAGETRLEEIGLYQVWWQSYGKSPVAMPLSWRGHFDPQTGISYLPWGRVLDRPALLFHSPWHVPPGKTWVDYRLRLPSLTPIRLSFGIAMGPDVAVPGKSDGVTFSCSLLTEGSQPSTLNAQLLLDRLHYDQGQWRDFSFDLSEWAGRTITLRLQVEPGPKNNSSWDYSFFGDAKITVGGPGQARANLLRELTDSRAYQAAESANLRPLWNNSARGITPANLLAHKNSLEQSNAVWRFVYDGLDCRIIYAYEPVTGTLDDFQARVDDTPAFQPALGGGATVTLKPGGPAISARGGRALEITRTNDTLHVLWAYEIEGQPLRIHWDFQLQGKALVVGARCDEPLVSAFSLGEVVAPLRKPINVPYLVGQIEYLPTQKVFACRYLDWTISHASMCPQGNATYEPQTNGVRNPLLERGYFAVSPHLGETLPNIPHPPSPFLATLGPNIMLDIWGHRNGTYAGDAASLLALKDHGIDHLVIIQHDWQRFGYDVKLPDHIPANPQYGGDPGVIEFGRAARECGYLWSLHENYIDLYPDAPSYDAAARVLLADGAPSKAWYNEGTKVQSYGLKCNRALGYARQNSPEIHRRYGTTASYLDVHTCVPPWHQLDHEPGQPLAAMALAKVKYDTELFQFERDTHQGPLFGEGANHFYWAGRCDGVEAQVIGGEDHAPLLEFDLLKIHPQMVNHGMGYYERWYRRGYDTQWGVDAGSIKSLDQYRAQELAYGHAGFLGAALVHDVRTVVREHHLMHPVQRLYGTSAPAEIRYEVEGRLVTAGAALIAGDTRRQRIRYDNGLTLWVNWRAEPWRMEPDPANKRSFELPQWGWLALGPDTRAGTTLEAGRVADYAECPEYLFADARTQVPLPYAHAAKDIEPRLRDFQDLGDNRVQVTYEWVVNESLDQDYHCFVHGTNPGEERGDHIVFQQDHPLPKPTRQWRKGEVIVDGPHIFQVSGQHDQYDLVIGLFKGARLRLKGAQAGGNRVCIAKLKLDKQAGKTRIVAEKPNPAQFPVETPADFAAHLNPAGTWIDFGKIATDGSVKINREPGRLVLFPYPRKQSFRVSLDLVALAPAADPLKVRVRKLAPLTLQDLGSAEFKVEGDRLVLQCNAPETGRYVVTWQ